MPFERLFFFLFPLLFLSIFIWFFLSFSSVNEESEVEHRGDFISALMWAVAEGERKSDSRRFVACVGPTIGFVWQLKDDWDVSKTPQPHTHFLILLQISRDTHTHTHKHRLIIWNGMQILASPLILIGFQLRSFIRCDKLVDVESSLPVLLLQATCPKTPLPSYT